MRINLFLANDFTTQYSKIITIKTTVKIEQNENVDD